MGADCTIRTRLQAGAGRVTLRTEMSSPELVMPHVELALRLVGAAAAGAILGVEREAADKPAGLRTHILVSLGAACFVLTASSIAAEMTRTLDGIDSTIDPTRIVHGVVGGIGFLGAGAILRHGTEVRGLTTAGSIWIAGAVGVASGAGDFVLAFGTALLAAAVVRVLGHFEHRLAADDGSESGQDAGGS